MTVKQERFCTEYVIDYMVHRPLFERVTVRNRPILRLVEC